MKYIRTEDGRIVNKNKTICYAFREDYVSPNWNDDIEKYLQTKIVAEADTIEDLIQVGDIVFYYDFHSQKEQCMYVQDLMFVRELNITKLLIPVWDDYKCVAKAEHVYLEIDSMKQVVKKGELKKW